MNWVIFTTASTSQQVAVNMDLVKAFAGHGNSTVLSYVDGKTLTVQGDLDATLAAIEGSPP